jgi:hypothetical protein
MIELKVAGLVTGWFVALPILVLLCERWSILPAVILLIILGVL